MILFREIQVLGVEVKVKGPEGGAGIDGDGQRGADGLLAAEAVAA